MLPSGDQLKVAYDGSNGHRYSSIGKLLVEDGKMVLEDVSMQSIRAYLKENPDSRNEILYQNNSYTFFKASQNEGGPNGNINVPLTRHRSVASDSSIFPKGALGYIVSEFPAFEDSWDNMVSTPFARFVLNQDTGGAIRGPGRVDLFWGNGALAERSAGTMRSFGKIYFLVAKKESIARHSREQLSE